MRNSGISCLLVAALGLAGCQQPSATATANPAAPVSVPPPVVVSKGRVAVIARAVLSGLEATAAAYVLSGHVSVQDQTNIAKAEVLAESFVNALPEATPTTFPTVLTSASQAVNEFVTVIPTDRVPASVVAAVSSFTVLAEAVAPAVKIIN